MGEILQTPFEALKEKYSKDWPVLTDARQRSKLQLASLSSLEGLRSENTSIVVFGSFARGELTSGSDIDWSLLIDGPADPEHFRVAQEIRKALLDLKLRAPGTTETFGTLASSHELIHHIGGLHDTNENMTRRILLLLESCAVTDGIAHQRVVRGILNRYIVHSASVSWREPKRVVPRFLLNDIVRFWRTMAVDYAAKRWEQSDSKWALRNVKLRMSRKILFVAGLLMCFNFQLNPPGDRSEILADPENIAPKLADFLFAQMRFTPIDIVSQALLSYGDAEIVDDIMDSYDFFLGQINDEHVRSHLTDLKFDDADKDSVFRDICSASDRFQAGLIRLFFGQNDLLRDLSIAYGVF